VVLAITPVKVTAWNDGFWHESREAGPLIINKRAPRWTGVGFLVVLLMGLPPLIAALPAKETPVAPLRLLRAIQAETIDPSLSPRITGSFRAGDV
jgi:hypothetical protein